MDDINTPCAPKRRPLLVMGTAAVALLIVFLLATLLDRTKSRSTTVVEADVVMFNVSGSKFPSYETIARLDGGETVRAQNRTGLATIVGARVELLERTGWLSGLRRYSVKRVLPTPTRPARSDSLESFPKPAL